MLCVLIRGDSNEHPQHRFFMKKNAKVSLNYHQISSNTHLISSADRPTDKIRVGTFCHSICIFWKHSFTVRPICSSYNVLYSKRIIVPMEFRVHFFPPISAFSRRTKQHLNEMLLIGADFFKIMVPLYQPPISW